VIIQTVNTEHRILTQVLENDYRGFFGIELNERHKFHYPPFFRLIGLDVKHKDSGLVNIIAERLAGELRKVFGHRILGPEFPLIGKIRNYYIKRVMIKIERDGISVQKVKQVLKEVLIRLESDKLNKGSIIQIDVDPY
jgi:primosomal protein N' (replication factor Y)